MGWLLNIIYLGALTAAMPFFAWSTLVRGRRRGGLLQKFFGLVAVRKGDRPCVWLHAVSVGEVNLLATIIQAVRNQSPSVDIYVTTTTKSGYELARARYDDCVVSYAPLDFTWAVKTALRRIRPQTLILAELEIWPNLISISKARGVNVAVVNGRLSEKSYQGYRRVSSLLRPVLRKLDCIAVQDWTYAERFVALGAPAKRVISTGSLKFDGAETNRRNLKTMRLRRLAEIPADAIVFLAGSTQAGEEEAALNAFLAAKPRHPNLRLILVPRHPERFDEVAAMLDERGVNWSRRSSLEHSVVDPTACVLLVDTVGELAAWWGVADVAFVGGSFGRRGGQNMIEPAAYGAAVSFGPNTKNFRDIVQMLLEEDAAVMVADEAALIEFVGRCLDEPEYCELLGDNAQQVVASQIGAVERTMEALRPFLPAPEFIRHRMAA
ncbi:3-deoxy-D-manno-octulosonic acid transferase [Blastopirellula sp. JC732]|uniref:3-deoxy-D-manno-octulosonic acid transferase n=1 Tax=Blastopirellula sediminis TaxID=2894196 RepID=A0A9X1MP16_9BACT|nr:3-deoxy-D-manno-octulosonic acid transferase [Blastopirellula sediminis]MCC9605858.1 3-deoxy-D-manno-octulosonic acid transferase [Blastopirellula sediminis]MCC9630843.1 3-deoxy-D-manno-octulosonic acid transferase [Blastopirellula sediminis]